jgi:hypothetical protein
MYETRFFVPPRHSTHAGISLYPTFSNKLHSVDGGLFRLIAFFRACDISYRFHTAGGRRPSNATTAMTTIARIISADTLNPSRPAARRCPDAKRGFR